jgi:subtilisin-like proprotein convertase family protein
LKQRDHRWLALALVGTLALAFAAAAGGKQKTKTFSSGTINLEFEDFETASAAFHIRKKRSKVKDVNVGVRITSDCEAALAVDLIGRDGQRVELSNPQTGKSVDCDDPDYGSGSASCTGQLAIFDDEAAKGFEGPQAPGGGPYRPDDPLSTVDRSKLKGTWRVEATDTDEVDDTSTLHCVELEIKYRKKKKD